MNAAFNYSQSTSFSNNRLITHEGKNLENTLRFEIHALEWKETQRSFWNGATEKLSCFEVIWMQRGTGVLEVDGQDHKLTENTIFCISPGHTRKCNMEPIPEGYYLSFTLEFIQLSEGYTGGSAWLNRYTNSSNITTIAIDDEVQCELDVIVHKMKWEFGNYYNRRSEVLKGLLNIFMIYLSRILKDPCPDVLQTREMELLNKFTELLKKNFIAKKMVSDYAYDLCVTSNYLNRIVKKTTGFTASHHIQQQIILEAKRQAMSFSTSMKQTAYNLGFDNLSHFSKFFKHNCGMNFTDFKRGNAKS